MAQFSDEALTSTPLDIDFLRDLIALVEEADLAELTVSRGEVSITVRRSLLPPQSLQTHRSPTTIMAASLVRAPSRAKSPFPSSPSTSSAVTSDDHLFRITAPLTGVFYSRPRPDAPTFVTVGAPVERGQVVALVEAMKFFNEVRSEVKGIVREIVAKDGQLVRQGDTLIIVERKD